MSSSACTFTTPRAESPTAQKKSCWVTSVSYTHLDVYKRQYLTRVKTKGFIIGTIIVPLIGVAFCLLIIFLVNHKPTQTMRLVIVDNSGTLAQPITCLLYTSFAD